MNETIFTCEVCGVEVSNTQWSFVEQIDGMIYKVYQCDDCYVAMINDE